MSGSADKLRIAGAALAALAAGLLVFGSWSTAWWSGQEDGLAFSAGLRFVEMCGEGECRRAELAAVGASGWMRIGIGAFSAGNVGAALLLAAALRRLAAPGAHSMLPGGAVMACVAAAILGLAFFFFAPEEVTGLDRGWAAAAYFAGAALGAGSAGGLLPAGTRDGEGAQEGEGSREGGGESAGGGERLREE